LKGWEFRLSSRPNDPADYTPFFAYRDDVLHCEGVSLSNIAERVGTPAYVYSRASILSAYQTFRRVFRAIPHTICYAVKANSNLSLLRLLAGAGSSFDIVSGGELYRLLCIGVPGRRIVFSGVGKTREEIREALRARILLFNVESESELELLSEEAARFRRAAPAALRLNPDVVGGGHPHISTGRHQHKFGIGWDDALALYTAKVYSPWISWRGLSTHIGSQILTLAPFRRAVTRIASFARLLVRSGVKLSFIDFGGGLGVRYTSERPPAIAQYADVVIQTLGPLGCRLLLEPGRAIVGPAGILLTRVIHLKRSHGKTFTIVDAAMNDFIRPALYGAIHPMTPVVRKSGKVVRADIVGPVCETGDAFLHDWPMQTVQPGDLLALWGAGAYGFIQASNYNSRPRSAEVLVRGKTFSMVRRRESNRELIRGESL
jgi:diaminopimelate decarboxylase